MVEAAFADVGHSAEFLDTHIVVAALEEQPRRGRHDAIPGVGRAGMAETYVIVDWSVKKPIRCGAGPQRMVIAAMSSTTPEVFRTPDARFENLPGYGFAPNYLEVDGLRMQNLDEGPREGARSCVSMANPIGPTCTARCCHHSWRPDIG